MTAPPVEPPRALHSQALARDPSLWSAWYGLGLVKGVQGKYADAVEALCKWLEGREKNVDGEGRSSFDVSAAGGLAREGGGRGGGGGAALVKGLVQLGDAYRKLGQVRGRHYFFTKESNRASLLCSAQAPENVILYHIVRCARFCDYPLSLSLDSFSKVNCFLQLYERHDLEPQPRPRPQVQ